MKFSDKLKEKQIKQLEKNLRKLPINALLEISKMIDYIILDKERNNEKR